MNDVTIGIVTFNSQDVIATCLESIAVHYGDKYRVLVVDNNSTDNTHDIITRQFPSVEVFNTGDNYGFGYGVNLLVAKSKTPYTLIVNADIILDETTITPLVATLENNNKCVIAAPVTSDTHGNGEGNIRNFPSIKSQFCESFFGGGIASRLGLSETILDEHSYENTHEVDWLKGAIWCVRRETFMALGGMRTDFFLYSEETEFAARAYDAGGTSMIVADAHATHSGGQSDVHPLLYSLLALNKVQYMKVRERRGALHAVRDILFFGMLLRAKNAQSRAAFLSILRSYGGFERERRRLIKKLDGRLSDPSFSTSA